MLKFLNRDMRDHSKESMAQRRYMRMKGKSLKNILLDRFLNNYGYDKGIITAGAIVDDLLNIIENFYRYSDNSFIKNGQMVYHAVPIDEYPRKGKSIAQTKLKPVVLDIISDQDIEDMKIPLHHREIRIKKIERWTHQAYDQGALLSQLDLAMLLGVNEYTAGLSIIACMEKNCPLVVISSSWVVDKHIKRKSLPCILMATSSLLSVKEQIILKKLLNVISAISKPFACWIPNSTI
jgi:hypothetical protein